MTATLTYPTAHRPPAPAAMPPSCRYCCWPIQLSKLTGEWSWTHVASGQVECPSTTRCRHCSEPIRRAGASWVHIPRPTYVCPEELRAGTEITFAAPAVPDEVTR